ncbi:hypothetical protein BDZ90DRAFT_232040 [Jaminaea rosea]|uniref:Glucose-repressible protein n=1 Tax=Jaminaea rosea TaxID=1569628 RepID=A0A316UUM7_9BASI|nr:hypothetical protein BDZ90DRAFT_232040 [Jaminaea rosea]PWN27613.1 hypothetical protein BDZ90DRAFT_232040 [Jaminaea rosea]
MQAVKDTINQASEKVQELGSGASKEANKDVAKNSDASIGTRAEAAKDAVSDKMDEASHGSKADLHGAKRDA